MLKSCTTFFFLLNILGSKVLFFSYFNILNSCFCFKCVSCFALCWMLCVFFCLHRDTFVLCLVNGGSSFVAGFAIFSVLGFMSYEQGLPISEVAASGRAVITQLLLYLMKSLHCQWVLLIHFKIPPPKKTNKQNNQSTKQKKPQPKSRQNKAMLNGKAGPVFLLGMEMALI